LNPAKNSLLCLLLFESCGVAILDRLQVLTLKHKLSLHFEDFVRDLYHSQFFNVFNIQNYGVPNSLIGVAGAGLITSNVLPPREMQFGLHLGF
jgi:hypothetical protein